MQLTNLIKTLETAPITRPLANEGENELRLSAISLKLSQKTQEPMIEAILNCVSNPDASGIFHYFMVPDETKQKSYMLRLTDLKRFTVAFGIALEDLLLLEGTDPQAVEDAFVGKTGWAILKHEAGGEQYEPSAKVKKWIIADGSDNGQFVPTVASDDIPF